MNYMKHKWLAWLVMFAITFSLITPAGWVMAKTGETTVSLGVEDIEDMILESGSEEGPEDEPANIEETDDIAERIADYDGNDHQIEGSVNTEDEQDSGKTEAIVQVQEIDESIDKLIGYYHSRGVPPSGSDWVVFGLNALGEDVNRGPYVEGKNSYAQKIMGTDPKSVGDISKKIIAIQSLGYDPTSFGGKDWVEKLEKHEGVSGSYAIYSIAYGLIALDTAGAKDLTNVNKWINQILTNSRVENGWGYSGNNIAIDMTAMAMFSLAPYYNQNDEVKQAIDKAIIGLQKVQQDDGGIGNISSSIEVIQALTMLGVDPQGEAFTTENGNNLVTNLLTYQLDNGGFKLSPNDNIANAMASEKALIALAALKQFYTDGKATVYTDIRYAGGVPPLFTIKPNSAEWDGGLYATATISPFLEEHSDPVYIVFQLTKDKEPISIIALKETVTTEKEVTAFFNVSEDEDYRVKIFALDHLTDLNNIGTLLSEPAVVQ